MEMCRRMKRLQCMSKNWTYSWLWKSSKTRQQFYRLESFAMKTDTRMSGSTIKNHISLKMVFGYNATRRTSFLSWFQARQRVLPLVLIIQLQWHLQDRRGIVLHLLQARFLHQRQQHQVIMRLEKERIELKVIPLQCWCQVSMLMIERGHPLFADSGRASSEIPEWLQELREFLVDDEVPEHRDSHASSSHEVSLAPTSKRREDLGKHSVYTHFPKDRNCEICQRTKITRAPCRRRNGGAVPRAESFWWLDNSRSQSSQWKLNLETITDMQSSCRTWPPNGSSRIRVKQKLHRKHTVACKSSWSQIGNLKSFTLTIPWNLAKPVKIFPGIIARLHHIDQTQMGLLKEQCAEWRKAPLL